MSEPLRLRATGLEWRSLDGEVVAMDVPRSLYLGANHSGSLLWEALVGGATREELLQMLIGEYSLDRTIAERDLDAFVADLRQHGLLEPPGG